ncbi:hypothetical protein CC2G_003360 [Coprinopsis cinerea AmutBmut pab1-1]|nr:hypothetical protein CC2G_003360 [Coprinopsis cinerea AmutBmut pab1-1]
MAGPSPPEDMPYEEILDIARKGLYVQVAALTIILWDYCKFKFSSPNGIGGKRKWSPVHVLYFIARYMGSMVFISTLALRRCVRKSVGLVAYIAILMIFHIFETLGARAVGLSR